MLDAHSAGREREPFKAGFRFNGVQVGTRVIPAAGATRGGDWCEAFPIGDDVIALSIGDVCGHGAEKFETMAAMRQAIREACLRGLGPAATLAEANRFLAWYEPGEIATAVFGLLDTRRRTLVYANAGHPAPLMVGTFGSRFLEKPVADLPLGVIGDLCPVQHSVGVPAATLLVFYTDGVSESGRDALNGIQRLRNAAKFAHTFPELPSASTIDALMLPPSNFDDAAILTVRTPHVPGLRTIGKKAVERGTGTIARLRALSAACLL